MSTEAVLKTTEILILITGLGQNFHLYQLFKFQNRDGHYHAIRIKQTSENIISPLQLVISLKETGPSRI